MVPGAALSGLVAPTALRTIWTALVPSTQATMTGANLSGADLSGCDLSGADMTDCVLIGAKTYSWNVQGEAS